MFCRYGTHGAHKHEALNWHKSSTHHKHKIKLKHANGSSGHAPPGIATVEGHTKAAPAAKHTSLEAHPATPPAAAADQYFDFDVVSFNLLAPVYKRLTTKNAQTGRRHREAGSYDLWSERLNQTAEFFKQEIYANTAIIALQEYWLDVRYRKVFEEQFAMYGYDFRIMQRTGTKVDAVALIIKKDLFEIKGAEYIDLATLGDRVALLLWLRHKHTGYDLLVANTHLSFPHSPTDQQHQVMQMQHLTSVIDRFARVHDIAGAPALIMGDFNVEGRSMVCDHLRSAGYFSCFEVCPPVNCPVSEYTSAHAQDTFVRNVTASATDKTHINRKTTTNDATPQRVAEADRGAEIAQFPAEGFDENGCATENDAESVRAGWECDDIGDNCIDPNSVVTPPATLDTSPSDDSPHYPGADHSEYRSVSYVSHFNHRSEEVGVDHIFIKPTSATFAMANSDTNGSANGDASGGADHNTDVSPQDTPLDSKLVVTTSLGEATPAGAHHAKEVAQVFVAECQVLPATVSCTSWFNQFKISDHRPVRTKIIFTKPEHT